MTGTPKPQMKLKEALEQATAVRDQTVAREKAAPAAEVSTNKFAKIEDNPFYKILVDPQLKLSTQRRDKFAELLTYDKGKSEEQNAQMAKDYVAFVEYMQEQRLQSAKSNIKGQNAKVMAELKTVIDEFSKGFVDFKQGIAPFLQRLESVYNVRLSGKAVGLLEEIVEDRKAEQEAKELLEQKTQNLGGVAGELASNTETIEAATRDIAALGQEHRLGMSFLGLKKEAAAQKAQREIDLQLAQQKSADLAATVERMTAEVEEAKNNLGKGRGTAFADLASDKEELKKMLDISNEDHVKAHEDLKDTSLKFIETSERRIEAVLANVEDVNNNTARSARKNGKMVITAAIMNEGVKVALENNQKIITEFEPPEDPAAEDEITKAEREETFGALKRHIKSVSLADAHTTEMRNALTVEKEQLESMLQANDERIRATKHLKTSGIANMSTEMAVTMTALADAANSEAVHMAQTMVDTMGKTAQDIRAKEVLRQAMDMGVRNEALAAAILATKAVKEVAEIGMEEQYKALKQLNKNLSGMTDVTADLQRTLEKNEGVYQRAQRDAATELAGEEPTVTVTPAANENDTRKKPVSAPAPKAPDPFG